MRTQLAMLFLVACSSGSSLRRGDAAPSEDLAAAPDLAENAILSASWQKLPSAPSIPGKQDDVYFVDAMTGWSINGLGRIYHTSDGGATWTKQLDQPGTYFRAIVFTDAMHGFASNIGTDYYPGVTDTTPLYKTSDGGATWTPVTSITGPAPKGICNFSRIDAQHIVATGRVGGPSFFLKTSDGGATWSSSDLSAQIAMLIDSSFSSADEGFITGGTSTDADANCVILHTTNGGTSWQTAFTSENAGEICWKFSFPSKNIGYASVLSLGGGPSSFLKTTDGGQSWQQLPLIDDTYNALGVGFITDEIGWIGGESSAKPVYRTSDGGKTWQPDRSLGAFINRFRFVGGVGYAIGSTIYKLEVK